MSAVSLPVTRPIGRALVIAAPTSRQQPLGVLQRLGYSCAEVDDAYSAMLELCRKPLVYRAVIVSLASLYREELAFIDSVKRRFGQIEIWLTQIDGRQAALAEAMRLGADGLLADDGLHRIAITPQPASTSAPVVVQPASAASGSENPATDEKATATDREFVIGEPVLTAEELRALLHEQPSFPPNSGE
jgi:hypothetical protein